MKEIGNSRDNIRKNLIIPYKIRHLTAKQFKILFVPDKYCSKGKELKVFSNTKNGQSDKINLSSQIGVAKIFIYYADIS